MSKGKMLNGKTKKALMTGKFYKKFAGMITWNRKKVMIIQETEKAWAIQEKIQNDKEMYGNGFWIPKSKIKEVIFLEENKISEKKMIIIRINYNDEETGEFAFTNEEEKEMTEEEFYQLVKYIAPSNIGGGMYCQSDDTEWDWNDGYINYTDK